MLRVSSSHATVVASQVRAYAVAAQSVTAIAPKLHAGLVSGLKQTSGAKKKPLDQLLPVQTAALNALVAPQDNYAHLPEEARRAIASSTAVAESTDGASLGGVAIIRCRARGGRKLAIAASVLQHLLTSPSSAPGVRVLVLTPTLDVADLIAKQLRELIATCGKDAAAFTVAVPGVDPGTCSNEKLLELLKEGKFTFPTVLVSSLDRWSFMSAVVKAETVQNVKMIAMYDADIIKYTIHRLNFLVAARDIPLQQTKLLLFSPSNDPQVENIWSSTLKRSLPPVIELDNATVDSALSKIVNVHVDVVAASSLLTSLYAHVLHHISQMQASGKTARIMIYAPTADIAHFFAEAFSSIPGFQKYQDKTEADTKSGTNEKSASPAKEAKPAASKSKSGSNSEASSSSKAEASKETVPILTTVYDLASNKEIALKVDPVSHFAAGSESNANHAIGFSSLDARINQAFVDDLSLVVSMNAPVAPRNFGLAVRGIRGVLEDEKDHDRRNNIRALVLLSTMENLARPSIEAALHAQRMRILPVTAAPSLSIMQQNDLTFSLNAINDATAKIAWLDWLSWAYKTYRDGDLIASDASKAATLSSATSSSSSSSSSSGKEGSSIKKSESIASSLPKLKVVNEAIDMDIKMFARGIGFYSLPTVPSMVLNKLNLNPKTYKMQEL